MTTIIKGNIIHAPELGRLDILPGGHLVLEDGGWYYVCVPREEMGCLMDVQGTCGWLKKEDVITAGMACQLDWLE